jgi:hypothetical protein
MQSFLFEKYIPGLKSRAAVSIFDRIRNANPHLTAEEAAGRAADMTNDLFGGQNWKKLGVTTAQQDFARMFALAPDWLLSELRMGARAMGFMDKETGALSRQMMIKQMAAIWAGARVLNMLITGNMHNEAPFGVAYKDDKGQEKVVSVRTLPTDIIHALSSPQEFLRGRVNPLTVRPAVEFATGRDQLGRRVTFGDEALDTVRNIVPIAGQGLIRNNPLSGFEQFVKGAGGNVYRYRTEAEKLAEQYASDRTETGPVDKDQLEQHQKEIMLEDQFRLGKVTKAQMGAVLSPRRVNEIVKRVQAKYTPFQARFDRLPMSEAINVWDAATPTEKEMLHAQLWKKRQAWLKAHPAQERPNEPVWRKMQATWGDLRPTPEPIKSVTPIAEKKVQYKD